MLENNLQSVMNITAEIFKGASIGGVAVFSAKKSEIEESFAYSQVDDVEEITDGSFNTQIINKEYVINTHLNKFYSSKETYILLNKLMKSSDIKLSDVVKSYQGIITGNNKKFLSSKKINKKYKKILKGRDINKYNYQFSDNYILFEPEKLWSNTNTDYFYQDEKIISRETSDKLIGAYDTNKMLTLDSTHIHFLINDKFYLKYILALFNSKLINYLYQIFVNENKRTFAQVKIVILKMLPIKEIPKSEQQIFVNKIDEILEQKTNITKLETEIDQLIYKIYNLTTDEIKTIENL